MRILFVSDRKFGVEQNIVKLWNELADGQTMFAINGERYGQYDYTEAEHDGFDILITDDYLMPIKDKKHLKIIDIGHGIDGFKICGEQYSRQHRLYPTQMFTQVDWAIAASDETGMIRRRESLGEAQIAVLGVPRTDDLINARKRRDYYLYAPSWRNIKNDEGAMPAIDWSLIDSRLSCDETLVVKRHPCTTNRLLDRRYDHIIEVDKDEDTTAYLLDASVVLTDYSSIMADAYLAGKPCVIFAPDKAAYLSNRGMYYRFPEEYSDYEALTETDIVSKLRYAQANGIGLAGECFIQRVASACDGHSTERIAEFVRSL